MHSHIGEFDCNVEDLQVYTEQLQIYFIANDVENHEKQRAILLSVCGPSTYLLIRSLVSPDHPDSRSYNDIMELVRQHYPKPSPIVSRFRFNLCVRQSGEMVAAFIAKLRQLAEHCQYSDTLEEMVRDRLVCGINDERLQRHLLAEPE